MNPDDHHQDEDDELDYEKLRRRRLEELGEPPSKPAPPSSETPSPRQQRSPSGRATPRKSAAKKPSARQRRAPSPQSPPPLASQRPPPAVPELTPLDGPAAPSSPISLDTDIQPSTVDRRRLPTPEPPRKRRQPRPPGAPLPAARASSILIGLGAACIVAFIVLQFVHTSGTATVANQPGPNPVPTQTQTTPAPGPTTSTPTTPAPPPVATVRWTHAVTLGLNSPLTFSSYPPTQTPSFGHGLEVDQAAGTTQLVADGDGDWVAPWSGRGAPSASNCSGGGGGDRVQLGGSGIPTGGWICAHSASDYLRLRYLSGHTGLVSSGYRFLVTVWNSAGGSG